jgi:uncharacterized protein (TIGR03435 family)
MTRASWRLRLGIWLWGVVWCAGQTAPPVPQFAAATVKPSNTGDNNSSYNTNNGRVTVRNETLKQILTSVYSVREFQISGGPGWLDADRFSIDAVAESKSTQKDLSAMMQSLLAERFQLALRKETRPFAGYALVAAKGGIKIQPVDGEGSGMSTNNGKLTARHASMDRLADWVARQVERPVVNETGIEGGFDFTLEWARERGGMRAEPGDGAGPTIFTALSEQLGLRLESKKVPVEVLIIDKAEKPAEN